MPGQMWLRKAVKKSHFYIVEPGTSGHPLRLLSADNFELSAGFLPGELSRQLACLRPRPL